jgi:hypothetical protein
VLGQVGEDLDVVFAGEAEGQREGDLGDFAESGVGVELLGDLLAGADEVAADQVLLGAEGRERSRGAGG